MNKKAFLDNIQTFFILPILLIFGVFLFFLITDIYNEDINTVVVDVANNTLDISNESFQIVLDAQAYGNQEKVDLDIFVIFILLSTWATFLTTAFFAPAMPRYSYLSVLVFGTLIFIFATAIYTDIVTYLFDYLLSSVVGDRGRDITSLNAYINNIYFWNTIAFISVLLVNQYSPSTRIKEESEDVIID